MITDENVVQRALNFKFVHTHTLCVTFKSGYIKMNKTIFIFCPGRLINRNYIVIKLLQIRIRFWKKYCFAYKKIDMSLKRKIKHQ